jgi:hypothetical protein
MRDTLIILATIASALTALFALVFDDNITKLQGKIAAKSGLDAPAVLNRARNSRAKTKTAFVLLPAILAVGLNVFALFTPTSSADSHAPSVTTTTTLGP